MVRRVTVSVEVNGDLLVRLMTEPELRTQVKIDKCTYFGEGFYLLHVSSPMLPPAIYGTHEIIVEGDSVRFKIAADT